MKITPQDFDRLKNRIENLVETNGGWDKVTDIFETGNFPRSEKVKDLQKRFVWDLMFLCKDHEFIRELYVYLNDSHIETALKKICPTITRRY